MDSFINMAKKGYEAYEDSQRGQGQGQGQVQGQGQTQGPQGGQGYQQSGQGYQQSGQGYQQSGQGYGGSQQGYQQSGGQGGYNQDSQGGYNQGNQGYNQGSSGQSNQYGQSGQGGYGGNQGQYGHNQPSAGGYGSQGPDFDQDDVIKNANQHAGGSGDSSMFGSAMSFLNQNQSQHTQPVDENRVQDAHAQAYQNGKASSLDAGSLGSAAAMQVLKNFTSGGGSSGGSGNSQSQLISMAMAEAAKLFESQGSASGGKQDAVNGAAMTVMKLLVQSKMGGAQTTGGANRGGLGQLMGLASQFMK